MTEIPKEYKETTKSKDLVIKSKSRDFDETLLNLEKLNLDDKKLKVITLDELKIIIKNNDYVKSCKSNNKKDKNSLSYLIDYNLSQSDSIKLGSALEYIFRDIINKKSENLEDIKPKNSKEKKEKDFLYKDNKKIYYAELKSNLNLDTEKSKSTINKCLEIEKELKKEFEGYEINMFLISGRYIYKNLIPKNIYIKYDNIKENLLGINEFFNKIGIDINFSEKSYNEFLNCLAKNLFKH
jgi:hypothetical protein